MKQFDPAKPRFVRALVTLRQAKKLQTTQATVDAAIKYLCALGVSYRRATAALVRGGYTPAEALAMVTPCYSALPIAPPPP